MEIDKDLEIPISPSTYKLLLKFVLITIYYLTNLNYFILRRIDAMARSVLVMKSNSVRMSFSGNIFAAE